MHLVAVDLTTGSMAFCVSKEKSIPAVCNIFDSIMHLQKALRSLREKSWKNNLLFVSPSIRRPTLAVKLIAEIGDIRRLHSAKALIAWAGIDPPPYESGQFIGSKRKITKRGSSTLRKVGYEVMRVLKSHPAPKDDAVYNYILKKESEGKSKKHAKIAGLNKFLRIYYARVMAVYQ
ncbi:transposase, IS116/IS110/IS902 family [[Clostridium] scindens ATCC 35704]|uniref:Uncharacterized protein n=1 Tax=Clostridium scindens (strain ATCC 35704 / DSM 5676 / VPI 13733 / 19) TaxID=411468 RepID=B0NDT1_CLOS5|nr:transposase [[Clostridium] scindens]EDS07266.1 transposase, IS116/IS110/IS902 family [[Clostridium] scindens ATCC 35704]QBF72877.1 hypothetical protein HDCHBGLK_00222 [[Clostridium] scindens ATCC 35704]WPB35653.1 hypothetical protein PBLEJBOC_00293 [[Clostridium] scindens]BDF17444.1 hypothetical protein CE91St59_27070 [[Clostridium] scindens]BDF21142.1 hypothetical protein CE91St60_27250 [[Clostridium] scindens]